MFPFRVASKNVSLTCKKVCVSYAVDTVDHTSHEAWFFYPFAEGGSQYLKRDVLCGGFRSERSQRRI